MDKERLNDLWITFRRVLYAYLGVSFLLFLFVSVIVNKSFTIEGLFTSVLAPIVLFFIPLVQFEYSWWHAVPMFIMLVSLLGLIYLKIETRKWLFIILALSIWMIYAVLFLFSGDWNWMAGVW